MFKQFNYNFKTTWTVQASPQAVDAVIQNVSEWPKWWQGLREARISTMNAAVKGSRAVLIWQAAGGYKLITNITITEYVPSKRISFISTGDLSGSGSWSFDNENGQTKIEITWQVTTMKRWMNILAPLLRPVFIQSHNLLMRRGEKGLSRYVAQNF